MVVDNFQLINTASKYLVPAIRENADKFTMVYQKDSCAIYKVELNEADENSHNGHQGNSR